MLTNIWEPGTKCSGCGREFAFGEEALYGRCMDCARQRAENRDDGEPDAIETARAKLAMPGRLTLTRRQLRALVTASGVTPVRKPDAGRRFPLYGRMPGWSAERVAAGLDAPHVAGLWLDFLDVGKVPPLRHCDLEAMLAAIGCEPASRSS